MQQVTLSKRCAEQPTLSTVHGLRGPSVLRQPAHGLWLSKEALCQCGRGLSVLRRPTHGWRLSTRCISRSLPQANAALERERPGSYALVRSIRNATPNTNVNNTANTKLRTLLRQPFASVLRSTAAPGSRVGSGASCRSRRVALRGVVGHEPVLLQPRPNPSIEGTSNSKLRLPSAAPHVKR
jgi:hypothetical protein